MPLLVILLAFILVAPPVSMGQDRKFKSIEFSIGLIKTKATGPVETFFSGRSSDQHSSFGWFAGINKSWRLRSGFYLDNGIFIRRYSYNIHYAYPSGLPGPVNLSNEKYNYLFLSYNPAITYDIRKLNKIGIRPYAGISIDALLNSNVEQQFEGTPSQKGYSNLTNNERRANLALFIGIRFIVLPESRFPFSVNAMYNHYLNEQYRMGLSGFTLQSLQFGFGVYF